MIPNEEMDSDPRNLAYDEMMAFGGEIPTEGNVLARPQEILDQGRTASCTCHSTVADIHQTTGKLLSPRWGYWKLKRDQKYASSRIPYGAYMKEAAQVAVHEGLADYEICPNERTGSDEEYLALKDTKMMHESAKRNVGGSYLYVTLGRGSVAIFDAVVRYLWEQKRPVKVGVRWYKEYNPFRSTGVLPAKKPTSAWTGHDMCAVAWKEINGEPYLGFIQSWGKNCGDKGMCWMPRNYSFFYSPISIIPSIKQVDLDIKKPIWNNVRNLHKERANAQELTALVQIKFPRVGNLTSDTQNNIAQSIFGKEKLLFINAVSYLDWKFTDVINHLFARSRSKVEEDAYKLNFTVPRKEWFKK